MSENALWRRLRTNMIPKYWPEATRHEDKLNRGVCDVSFVAWQDGDGRHGWMELKQADMWPCRPTTTVKFPHYTLDQRNFLSRKGKYGGMTFLLVQVDQDFLLFNARAAQPVGSLTRDEMFLTCQWFCKGGLDYEGLHRAINTHG